MKEQLVTFPTAKIAKEKGFDWPCNSYINKRDGYYLVDEKTYRGYSNYNSNINNTSLPTKSLLQKWFRDVYNIYVEVYIARDIRNEYHICIKGENELFKNSQMLEDKYLNTDVFNSYEEALEVGLYEAV